MSDTIVSHLRGVLIDHPSGPIKAHALSREDGRDLLALWHAATKPFPEQPPVTDAEHPTDEELGARKTWMAQCVAINEEQERASQAIEDRLPDAIGLSEADRAKLAHGDCVALVRSFFWLGSGAAVQRRKATTDIGTSPTGTDSKSST